MAKSGTGDGIDRRRFLLLGGTTLFMLGLDRRLAGALPSARPQEPAERPGRAPVLVVFFQRGAADGLHMVAPYREAAYARLRGGLALKEPGKGDAATLDLGDGFALHPALGPLHALYSDGRLAVVHAVGSPDSTRSHFDAQDYMESGTPGRKGTRDGWLGRALQAIEAAEEQALTPFGAVALASAVPRSLGGAPQVMAMENFGRLSRSEIGADLASRVEGLYRGDLDPVFQTAGEEAFRAVELFRREAPLSIPVRPGVRYPRGGVGKRFEQLAQLIKADLGVRIACLDGGGWDTHFNQGGASGSMANQLRELAGSIAAFLADVGTDVPVTLLTATEFGRTVAPNGAGGTDHGHGTAMFVAGRGVHGGRVVGSWPGLGRSGLHEGRDLAITTDFRSLFGEVATRALGLERDLELFPGFRPAAAPGVMS